MSDDFEDLLRRWLRERGRADRDELAALAGRVAVLPPRRSGPRRPLLLVATFVVLVVALVAALPRLGQTVAEPSPSPSAPVAEPSPTTAALATYQGTGFSFDYPADWRVISEYRHEDLHGQTVAVAVGTGSFDLGCFVIPPPSDTPGGIECREPVWEVPDGGVVLAYYVRPYLGGVLPSPTLLVEPGEEATLVDGRAAAATTDPASLVWRWRLENLPWVIEARFGPENRKVNQAAVLDVIASWRWTPGDDATPAPAPTRPPWAADLEGALECDGPIQDIGGEVGSILPPLGGFGTASPYPWLEVIDDIELPLTGWVEDPDVPWETGQSGYVRFVNEVDGRLKATIVMAGHSVDGGQGHWSIVGYRACTADEFDPLRGITSDDAPWRDESGQVTDRVRAHVGPAHCGWESTTWLRFEGRLYLRDPLGLFADVEAGPYLPATELPADAAFTGFSSLGRELFATPDPSFVWVRTGVRVERWPRATEEFGCA